MLEGLAPVSSIRSCKVRTILETLEQEDQRILRDALSDRSWGDLNLTKALNDRGIDISNFAIRRHRRSECSCRKLSHA
jgi:hypothetical protein